MNIKPYTYDHTITQLFEKTVLLHPENIAVYLAENNVSYRQFNEDVNQYAHYFREKGVTRNLIVAVELPRSYAMLCVIFAILKAGGVYLPLSPDYPEKRKQQILNNSGATFVIVGLKHNHTESNLYQILNVQDDKIKQYSKENLVSINEPNDAAYVIYTSGSTGTPKGVMIAHHSLINRIEWMQDQFPIGTKDVLFQKTHCGFDVSIWELFWWSIAGAGVTLLPHGKEDDIILIVKTVIEKKVTVIHFVPTILRILLDYLEIKQTVLKLDSLRFVFASGEALDVKVVNQFNTVFHSSNGPYLINLYGPTEATIDVSYFVCDKNAKHNDIPIGKPIYNVELMVLDESFKPQQPGQIGELHISGVCLAKGYLNNPEQTERSFITLPHDPTKVVYKTGDLVKWNNKGELCYLGRKDHQVKINGIRIELGEIEHHLKTHSKVRHAEVLYVVRDNSIKRLVAFIKLVNKLDPIEPTDLKWFVQEQLPNYMHPNDYLIVDGYPLKENGKLDRKGLEEIYLEGL